MALPRRFTIEPFWRGATVIIIASGPSLTVRQLRAIARAKHFPGSKIKVIAINDAVYGAWWADWLHSCDQKWWFEHIQQVHQFTGIKTTLAEDVPAAWVDGYLENSGLDGFDPDPSKCRTGGNSGYQGIHIALHAGAAKIGLVGFDMKDAPNGEGHFFGEHRDGFKSPYAVSMIPYFATLLPEIARRGSVVFNCTPDSALNTFPMNTLENVLYN